ncbi:MAG: tetratricopeptide repeat protein, partial [Gammaproteobacteria bacterium]|nr:tetratricopeptide repeat protein [Gammaproteobacteria bacterium]
QQLSAAHAAIARGAWAEAEQRLVALINAHRGDRDALEGLASLYMKTGRLQPAEAVLQNLAALWPEHPGYRLDLAALLERNGKGQAAAATYVEIIRAQPTLAVARFNFACFLRRIGQPEAALREHQMALELKIAQPEEVLSNMAVINSDLRRDEAARELLERAIQPQPQLHPRAVQPGPAARGVR